MLVPWRVSRNHGWSREVWINYTILVEIDPGNLPIQSELWTQPIERTQLENAQNQSERIVPQRLFLASLIELWIYVISMILHRFATLIDKKTRHSMFPRSTLEANLEFTGKFTTNSHHSPVIPPQYPFISCLLCTGWGVPGDGLFIACSTEPTLQRWRLPPCRPNPL